MGFYSDFGLRPCQMGRTICLFRMIRNTPQPEGRQAKFVNCRTDYEEAGGQRKFGGNWVSKLWSVRLDKSGDRGVPGGVLVTFSPWKK